MCAPWAEIVSFTRIDNVVKKWSGNLLEIGWGLREGPGRVSLVDAGAGAPQR
jgi:hypothetical protein